MSTASQTATISSIKDYPQTPQGRYSYWRDELKGAQYMLRDWHKQADRVVARYLDESPQAATTRRGEGVFRLNLFYSNVQVVFSLLYGRVPAPAVSRQFTDANDDVGRVAATLMQRTLSTDMGNNSAHYDSVLSTCLEDRLVPGLGCARVRYEFDPETGHEAAPIDYVHWRDVLWSWSRTAADLRWLAFRSWVTKDEATKLYGEKHAENLEYKSHKVRTDETDVQDTERAPDDVWQKAEIWEIWCKETRTVYYVGKGVEEVLKTTPDPLRLRNFFPAPPFLLANPTSSQYRPTPDFHLTRDLYNEIDKLQTRIAVITEAVRVVGVYDAQNDEIKQMLNTGVDNKLIPVERWALLAERGGLRGVIDWFPVKDVVDALVNLRQLRDETIELLYQVSGMADVMRGNLANQYEGVGQTSEKVKFGSARVQKLQESYARFVSVLLGLQAEVIARHFEPETIAALSNAAALHESPEMIEQALNLIKRPDEALLRVKVDADALALADYSMVQAERTQYLTALSEFLTAAAPLTEQSPASTPFLLEMLQWGLAAFRGAGEIEGVLDRAIEAAREANQQEAEAPEQLPPEVQREQARAQSAIQTTQAKLQADMQLRQADMQADIQTQQAAHEAKMRELQAEFMRDSALIRMKAEADIAVEQATSRVNAEQQALSVEAEMNKDTVAHAQKLQEMEQATINKMREARASAAAKEIGARARDYASPPTKETDSGTDASD
jgi:hypothetical protein